MKNKFLNKIFPKRFDKYWEKTDVPYSKNILGKKNKLDYNSGDYEIPKNWTNIFKERIVFPSNMISLGFKVKE